MFAAVSAIWAKIGAILLLSVLPGVILLVFPAAHPVAPVAVFQKPLQGELDARLEIVLRCPAQLPFDFGRIDRVAPVMAGTVGDKLDLFPVRGAGRDATHPAGHRSG